MGHPSILGWLNRKASYENKGGAPGDINDSLATILKAEYADLTEESTSEDLTFADQSAFDAHIANLESDMRDAAKKIEFEKAAKLRDTIKSLRDKEFCLAKSECVYAETALRRLLFGFAS